ncbi:hypothetical protein ElyMa_003513000 [Elysia marginata]|uniref:Uncharacterized protein n=1 Tax=Elysia marginata TaxID=1093978 RepID=A0AAV4EFA1_9GAST|nr:hypothetical protein ElyMa_003513000 [Elysia marginata]
MFAHGIETIHTGLYQDTADVGSQHRDHTHGSLSGYSRCRLTASRPHINGSLLGYTRCRLTSSRPHINGSLSGYSRCRLTASQPHSIAVVLLSRQTARSVQRRQDFSLTNSSRPSSDRLPGLIS